MKDSGKNKGGLLTGLEGMSPAEAWWLTNGQLNSNPLCSPRAPVGAWWAGEED